MRKRVAGRPKADDPGGGLGVDGQLPAPSTKPAMGTTTSIHIQILPGRRKREAIDCGMEG